MGAAGKPTLAPKKNHSEQLGISFVGNVNRKKGGCIKRPPDKKRRNATMNQNTSLQKQDLKK
jgi:hypothetical protein